MKKICVYAILLSCVVFNSCAMHINKKKTAYIGHPQQKPIKERIIKNYLPQVTGYYERLRKQKSFYGPAFRYKKHEECHGKICYKLEKIEDIKIDPKKMISNAAYVLKTEMREHFGEDNRVFMYALAVLKVMYK